MAFMNILPSGPGNFHRRVIAHSENCVIFCRLRMYRLTSLITGHPAKSNSWETGVGHGI